MHITLDRELPLTAPRSAIVRIFTGLPSAVVLAVLGVVGVVLDGAVGAYWGTAAGQGVAAGLNAAATALDCEPVILGRDTAFIGVLVDDLVNRGGGTLAGSGAAGIGT